MAEKKKVYAYYDGSNFYHLAKMNYGTAKVLFHHLTHSLLNPGEEELRKIRYFNSPVNQQEDPRAYGLQLKFFEQLKKTPFLDLQLGRLVTRRLNKITIECPKCGRQKAAELNCPVCRQAVSMSTTYKTTEKGVDVQLALNLLLDALADRYDVALLFSGDADLCPAVKYIIKETGKEVIFCRFPSPRVDELVQCCSDTRLITKDMIDKAYVGP